MMHTNFTILYSLNIIFLVIQGNFTIGISYNIFFQSQASSSITFPSLMTSIIFNIKLYNLYASILWYPTKITDSLLSSRFYLLSPEMRLKHNDPNTLKPVTICFHPDQTFIGTFSFICFLGHLFKI